MSPEEHSVAIVHLQTLLGNRNAEVESLVRLLRPFAESVFQDSGHLFVDSSKPTNEDYIKAYKGTKKYGY